MTPIEKSTFSSYFCMQRSFSILPRVYRVYGKNNCLDYQKVEQKTLSFNELTEALSNILEGMNQPENKNPDYCSQCEMNKICLIGKGESFSHILGAIKLHLS